MKPWSIKNMLSALMMSFTNKHFFNNKIFVSLKRSHHGLIQHKYLLQPLKSYAYDKLCHKTFWADFVWEKFRDSVISGYWNIFLYLFSNNWNLINWFTFITVKNCTESWILYWKYHFDYKKIHRRLLIHLYFFIKIIKIKS